MLFKRSPLSLADTRWVMPDQETQIEISQGHPRALQQQIMSLFNEIAIFKNDKMTVFSNMPPPQSHCCKL